MKYMRKTPVEAIQWNGGNKNEVYGFIIKTVKYCCATADYGDLIVSYEDRRGRKFKAVIPLFGWVVRDDKTLLFYRDPSFKRTFEEVPDDDSKGVDWEGIIKTIKDVRTIRDDFDEMLKGCKGVFMAEPSKETLDLNRMRAQIDPNGRLTKLIDDFFLKDDEKTREEIKKNLSEGLKDMAGSDTNKATFDSVLDEMKELHAKKNKDYKGSFHDLFKEYGMPYALGHLEEKLNRVKAITANGGNAVKNDHIEDSVIDLASYAVMLYVELKNKDNGED